MDGADAAGRGGVRHRASRPGRLLRRTPRLPVLMPGLPADVAVHAGHGRRRQAAAALPGVVVRRAQHAHPPGHYGTWRALGPVSFSALAIFAAHMAAHAAQMSRHGHVTPGAGSVPDAPAA